MVVQPRYKLARIDQVCVVVKDLQKAMESYWSHFGIGPWRIYTFAAPLLKWRTYMGKPGNYGHRVALAEVGSLTFELIQQLEGESIFQDFVEKHGEGIHHLGVRVPSLAEATRAMEQQGFQVLLSGGGHGKQGDGAFAFLGTADDLGAIFEIMESPSERTEPEAIYPAP